MVIKPPRPLPPPGAIWGNSIFLAGSIEMGAAQDWQSRAEDAMGQLGVLVLNPRRDEWDLSWPQSITNPNFRQQVQWELDAQQRARKICFYFEPSTMSPITLMELGLACGGERRPEDVLVACPDGFWRKGNVEIMCARHMFQLVHSLEDLLDGLPGLMTR